MFKIPSDYVKDFLSLLYGINDLNKQSDINHNETDLCITISWSDSVDNCKILYLGELIPVLSHGILSN